ncbi:hypothetical protein GKE82_06455 [Conexibacter sp. W3-3-2]|uniref:hypothetical protein n=1 Tax=Conexibacter sp. W3-3-2 TaxID=2675227 RepID=UPI0012B7FCE2|nr:hypothetical protein [Conexibacter sp. W3-3-2]MTD43952.1 hypothetical protein [Conexibacter sp. W3-3-2]
MRPLLLSALLLVVCAPTAHAAQYRVTFSGTQELSWKVDGTTADQCEVRRGVGQGAVRLTVKGDRSGLAFSAGTKRIGLLTSIPVTGRGTISGRFQDLPAAPCGDAPVGEPVTRATDGCGPVKIGMRLDLKPVGAFTYLFGPANPGPRRGECPHYVDDALTDGNDFSACGDSLTVQHRRNWAVSASGGLGLFGGRLSAAQTTPLRKGRSRTLTVRIPVDCTVPSRYAGGVRITGVARYRLTLRRVD